MKKLFGVVVLFVLVLAPSGSEGGVEDGSLHRAISLECVYPGQTFGYWSHGRVLTGITEALKEDGPFHIRILSIDMVKGKAWFQSEWEEHEVKVLKVLTSLTLLDTSPTRGVRVITIFPHFCPDRKAYCSVMSEHWGSLGSVSPTQAFGFCKVK